MAVEVDVPVQISEVAQEIISAEASIKEALAKHLTGVNIRGEASSAMGATFTSDNYPGSWNVHCGNLGINTSDVKGLTIRGTKLMYVGPEEYTKHGSFPRIGKRVTHVIFGTTSKGPAISVYSSLSGSGEDQGKTIGEPIKYTSFEYPTLAKEALRGQIKTFRAFLIPPTNPNTAF